jgi:predicted transcriptional regulator
MREIKVLINEGCNVTEIAEILLVSRSTVHRYLKSTIKKTIPPYLGVLSASSEVSHLEGKDAMVGESVADRIVPCSEGEEADMSWDELYRERLNLFRNERCWCKGFLKEHKSGHYVCPRCGQFVAKDLVLGVHLR